MDAFFLTFKDTQLEKKYERHMAEGAFQVEKVFWGLSFAVVLSYLIRLAIERLYLQLVPMVLNFGVVLIVLYVRKYAEEALEKWRTVLYAFSRMFGIIGFAVAHSVLERKDIVFSSHLAAVFISMINVHHLLGALVPAMGCKLKFWHHLLARLMEAAMFLFLQTPNTCEQLLNDPGAPHVLRLERVFDMVWQTFLECFYSQMGMQMWKATPKKPCIHFASYMHIVWSFTIVSYIVWWMERRARVFFLDSLRRESLNVNPQDELPDIKQASTATNIAHLAAMVAWSGLAWELIALIPMFKASPE